jgi:hypothetical protein
VFVWRIFPQFRFGADPAISDMHGNNALHVLANNKAATVNAFIAHEVYTAGGVNLASAKNKNGETPYQVCSCVLVCVGMCVCVCV